MKTCTMIQIGLLLVFFAVSVGCVCQSVLVDKNYGMAIYSVLIGAMWVSKLFDVTNKIQRPSY